jgi:hypothetical protein
MTPTPSFSFIKLGSDAKEWANVSSLQKQRKEKNKKNAT